MLPGTDLILEAVYKQGLSSLSLLGLPDLPPPAPLLLVQTRAKSDRLDQLQLQVQNIMVIYLHTVTETKIHLLQLYDQDVSFISIFQKMFQLGLGKHKLINTINAENYFIAH